MHHSDELVLPLRSLENLKGTRTKALTGSCSTLDAYDDITPHFSHIGQSLRVLFIGFVLLRRAALGSGLWYHSRQTPRLVTGVFGSFHCSVYFVYLLISAYVPGGTQDRLLKASLDGSVLVVGRL